MYEKWKELSSEINTRLLEMKKRYDKERAEKEKECPPT
jgi:hypothetical protein